MKPYTAKTIAGAQRRVRELEKIVKSMDKHFGSCIAREKAALANCKILARLAAKSPMFNNPLEVWAAEKVRDGILREVGMNPDGTIIKTKGGVKP